MDKYYYLFSGDTTESPADIKMNECPEGYISFNDGEYVDWTQKKRVDGCLVDIPKDEQKPYVPTAAELLQQKINELNWEYTPQFDKLANAYTKAQMAGDAALMAEIAADNAELKTEYNTKMEAITND